MSERNGIQAALENGIPFINLGAQNGYWQARYSSDAEGNTDRTLICYKVSSTPQNSSEYISRDPVYSQQLQFTTSTWQDPILNKPTSALFGVEYGGFSSPYSLFDWKSSNQSFQSLIGANILISHLDAYVYDTIPANTDSAVSLIGSSDVVTQMLQPMIASTIVFDYGKKQTRVFNAGSIGWEQSLDESSIPGADIPNKVLGNSIISDFLAHYIQSILPIYFDYSH